MFLLGIDRFHFSVKQANFSRWGRIKTYKNGNEIIVFKTLVFEKDHFKGKNPYVPSPSENSPKF